MNENFNKEVNKEEFINYALDKVYFYIESKFWSKISIHQVNLWMDNFIGIDEKYFAAKLLDRFVYYSEEDIICLLKYGLKEIIFNELQLKHEMESNYKISEFELTQIWEMFKLKTALIPLGKGATDSSRIVARYLCNDIGFPEENVLDSNTLDSNTLKRFERILIIDDFLGSGDQFIEFWNHETIYLDGKPKKMFELNHYFGNIPISYFCLVATEEGIDRFYSEELDHNKAINIVFCELLKKKFKIFGNNSVYFSQDEIEFYRTTFNKISARLDIESFGHNQMDYAIAFHHCIPDASLPIFYHQTKEWNYLIRSKKTKMYDEF